jgi:hypothetical protein
MVSIRLQNLRATWAIQDNPPAAAFRRLGQSMPVGRVATEFAEKFDPHRR